MTDQGNAPQARLDQATDALHESERAVDQAKSAYEQAVNGYTKEERAIAGNNVEKASADIQSVQSIIDQLVVYAPVASQVYQRNVEPGEYVSPGVPLVTLINLADLWVHFDLREDHLDRLAMGETANVMRHGADAATKAVITELRPLGVFATWQAERVIGDHDRNTLRLRLAPEGDRVGLEPGMTVWIEN